MSDFPNELVEAAAKAAMEAEPGQNWECATAKEADVYLRDSVAVLAAVLPLIEQREEVCSRCGDHFSEHPGMPHVCGGCMIGTSEDDRVAAVEQRVIDRLAREAGGEPRTGRGGHARTGPRSSGKDATVSDELPDAQQEAVWPDQSAVHGVLLEQVKDAYAEGIADTIDRLRVRAAEILPEVARFTLDEIELAAADLSASSTAEKLAVSVSYRVRDRDSDYKAMCHEDRDHAELLLKAWLSDGRDAVIERRHVFDGGWSQDDA